MADDLASGFQSVDHASDFEVFSNCLTLIDSLPFFAECKRESYDLLGATPGHRILEVGCGLGDDAAALARRVAPGGSVVAVDGSQAMVDAARKRHGDVAGLSFDVADAAHLPFDDATFDGCRIDRVLQHIADPGAAIGEMVRVLRPGGVLVAFDNDWETMTADSADRALTRTVLNTWCDRFPSGWIGRRLVPLFLQAGLGDVVTYPKTLVLRDLEVADQVFSFISTSERLAESGAISRDDADRWANELRTANAEGHDAAAHRRLRDVANRGAKVRRRPQHFREPAQVRELLAQDPCCAALECPHRLRGRVGRPTRTNMCT